MRRGQVYQMGEVDPAQGWEKQPQLVYIVSPLEGVTERGRKINLASHNTNLWGYRGTIHEDDLRKIESKK